MSENLLIALQITVIGMSLVFGVIIVLWIVMSLLMRMTTRRQESIEEAAAPGSADQSDLKRRAAIAAVSVALPHELAPQLHDLPEPPTSFVGAWQAVQRSRYLTQRLYAFSRYGFSLWPPVPLGGQLSATPTLDSITNRIYMGSANGFLQVIHRSSGTVAWNSYVSNPVKSSAVVTLNIKLVLATSKGDLYGYNLNSTNTTPAWFVISNDSASGAPAVDNSGDVYLGTRGGAAVLGRKDIGSLEPGKCADFFAVNLNKLGSAGMHDPVSAIVFGHPVNADYTVVNGKFVVKEGQLVTVDERQLAETHNRAARRLLGH